MCDLMSGSSVSMQFRDTFNVPKIGNSLNKKTFKRLP